MKELIDLLRGPVGWPEEEALRAARSESADLLEKYPPIPLVPRITKSTAVAKIEALFKDNAELLKRFELAKAHANLWDGERDGLREVVKLIPAGRHGDVILEKTLGEPVMYPNADGKHQLEDTLQTTVPPMDIPAGTDVLILTGFDSSAHLLEAVLHSLQTSKATALEMLENHMVDHGYVVGNESLYSKSVSKRAKITILPEV